MEAVVVIVDGKIAYSNYRASILYGRPGENLVGREIDFATDPHQASRARQRRHRMLAGEELPTTEYSIRTHNGTSLIVEVSTRRITFDGDPALLMLCRDVTDRHRDRETIQKQRPMSAF